MKYKIGTRIDFIYEGGSEDDFHEYYKIVAYAITKDYRVVYLIWSNYDEYDNQYHFRTENTLAEEIKDKEDCGSIIKIRDEEDA